MVQSHSKKVLVFLIIFLLIIPILIINFSLSNKFKKNSNISLSPNDSPPDLDLSKLPSIDYETLNESWYNPKIEMVIVVPNISEFISAAEELKDWKNQKGVKTIVLSNFSLYPGRDNAEKIRNMIKAYYESDKIRWVLLAGDAQDDLIPIRKVYNPDTIEASDQFEDNFSEYGDEDFKPTDYYYAALDGTWDDDGDEIYGEKQNSNGKDEIDWTPEVYVGRLPASTAEELEEIVNKTINYEKGANVGKWMNRMLLAGGVSDPISSEDEDGEDEARLTQYIWQNYIQEDDINFTHLVRTTSAFNPDEPPPESREEELSRSQLISEINNVGYSTFIFAGHGGPTEYSDKSSGYPTYYTNSDASSANNTGKPILIYAAACTTSPYDKTDNSIGERFVLNEDGGAIGYIGASRVSWYVTDDNNFEVMNRGNAKLFWKVFFEDNKYQQGKALYDSKIAYMNSTHFKVFSSLNLEWERKNLLTYNLLGDPELDIFTNIPVKTMENIIPKQVYGGQLLAFNITNERGKLVPYGRVHITTENGIYHTIYANQDGFVKFRIPHKTEETYNVTISGHNLISTNFTFTTKSDQIEPKIIDYEFTPQDPTLSTNLNFHINTEDNESGIQSVFLILSKTNFKEYFYYEVSNGYRQNENEFNILTNKLDPGNYKFCICCRDYSNNTNIMYQSSFQFQIEQPVTDYLIFGGIIVIGAVAIVSIFIAYRGLNQYPKQIEILEKKQL